MADKKPTPQIELVEMLEAGVHFGHQSKRWNPKMDQYIWQNRDGVHIFDLLKVRETLEAACKAIEEEAASGKVIVFVGTKRQAANIVKENAIRAGVPHVTARWAGGTLTNWEQIKKSIVRLNEIKEGLKTGKFSQYTKKERVLLEREATRLERLFGGLTELKKQPDVLFVVDTNREKAAVREAKSLNVPVYAIVDSNCNPDDAQILIPGNDDAAKSVELLVSAITDAVIRGKEAGKLARAATAKQDVKPEVKTAQEKLVKPESDVVADKPVVKTEAVKAKPVAVKPTEKKKTKPAAAKPVATKKAKAKKAK
jgi:small subunit ribosomal protein S2